jgi:PAS domain S-box-containing protein
MLIVQWQTASIIQNIQENNAEDLLNAITNAVENEYHSIQFHRQATLKHRKEELRNSVDIAYTVVNGYFNEYLTGFKNQQQAQQLAKQSIRDMRWAEDVGYFWINDTTTPTPKMIMHPTLPELDGKVLDDSAFDCALGRNENLFRAASFISQTDGSGYVDYLWPKPTQDGKLTAKQPKLSFVRLFKPWNWVIGSGVYIDDIETESQLRINAVIEELRQTFKKMHIGDNSYMFMFTKEKQMLIHPELNGQDVSELLNPDTGLFLFDEIMLAEQSIDKTMEYRWTKPSEDANKLFQKKLYVSYFESLRWYICVSYYQDEINEPVRELSWRLLVLFVCILLVALVLSFLLGKNLTGPLKKLSAAAEIIKNKGIGATEIPISGSQETRDLGLILSKTLKIIGENEHSLRESENNLKQTEQELKHQLVFTQSLLTSIPTPVFFKDAGGQYIACNQAFSKFVGLSSDAIIGKTAFDLWPSDYAEKYHQMDMRLISGQKNQSIDYKILGADGLQHDVILNNDVLFDAQGVVSGFVGSFLDISERLQAEKAVKESELKYRQLVENATDAIFIAQDETIKFSNKKTSELTGYDIAELENIPFIKLIHPNDQAMVADRYIRRLKGDKDIPSSYSFRMLTRNNEEYTVLLSSILVEWKGRPAALCFARDITEQKVLEASLLQAQKMEAIGTLASGIAHDFNNLLMAILGRISLMSAGLDSSHHYFMQFQIIEENIKSATNLTRQLLGIARGGKYEARPIDINELLSNSSSLFGRTKKGLNIQTAIHHSPLIVEADKSQIEQVLLNLFVNASQAMPDGGEILLQTATIYLDENFCKSNQIIPGDYANISITDTGVGMDEETQSRIFDPFFTTKEMGRGTGLGLSSAFGIIKNHNGVISVRSKISHGSTFNIYLPLSDEEVVHDDIAEKFLHTGIETVLLVDDETIVLEIGREMLKNLGYEVESASGGEEALKIVSENGGNIDMVIMDMIMPGMDGETLFLKIRETYPKMPILLSSGYSLNEQAEKIMQRGCNGFIQKPFSLSDFSQKIRFVLDEEL